nr:DUF86 domain-containing protein [Evansella cellulosilytica]
MYFVDRELLGERLEYYKQLLTFFSEKESWNALEEKLALERVIHMSIETMIDVGNQMIDGFIMRDPGSYDDVIDILIDERVIEASDGKSLKRVIQLRKQLLQEYTVIDHNMLINIMKEELKVLITFPQKVRAYLENELGPVSAFLPQKNRQ